MQITFVACKLSFPCGSANYCTSFMISRDPYVENTTDLFSKQSKSKVLFMPLRLAKENEKFNATHHCCSCCTG